MANQDTYRSICQCCGRSGNRAAGAPQGGPPLMPPIVPGPCESSPTKKHMPRWEREN